MENGGAGIVSGIAFVVSLGAATLTVPDFVSANPYPTFQFSGTPYSDMHYRTDFVDYAPTPFLTDREKLAIINEVTRKITTDSLPLTREQHAILSDNLFDFL